MSLGTAWRTTEPAPVVTLSPTSTGATNRLPAPTWQPGADGGAVLVHAVIVGGNGARRRCWCGRQAGRRHVAQVRHLGAVADVRLLHFDERAGLGILAELVARAQVGPRPMFVRAPMCDSCTRERSTTAPSSTVASIRVVYGPTMASSPTTVWPCRKEPGRMVASRPIWTSSSIQVFPGQEWSRRRASSARRRGGCRSWTARPAARGPFTPFDGERIRSGRTRRTLPAAWRFPARRSDRTHPARCSTSVRRLPR